MFFVYFLKSDKDGDLYIGSTNNLKLRIEQHNSGKTTSTKLRGPFNLAYYEAYQSEKEARQREHNLKLRSNAYRQLKRRIAESIKAR